MRTASAARSVRKDDTGRRGLPARKSHRLPASSLPSLLPPFHNSPPSSPLVPLPWIQRHRAEMGSCICTAKGDLLALVLAVWGANSSRPVKGKLWRIGSWWLSVDRGAGPTSYGPGNRQFRPPARGHIGVNVLNRRNALRSCSPGRDRSTMNMAARFASPGRCCSVPAASSNVKAKAGQ